MKILFVTYCRAMLGANLCMVQLIKELKEYYGVESFVLMPDVDDGMLHLVLEQEGIPYLIHSMKAWVVSKDTKYKRLRGIKYSLENNKNINSISNILDKRTFDLVYSNNSVIQIGALLAEKWKKPHIWHVREYARLHYDLEFCYSHSYVDKLFNKAKKVVGVSRDLTDYVNREYHLKRNAICIYNGIYSTQSARVFFNTNQPLNFCYTGALQAGKNQMELLQATKYLIEQKQSNFHVYLIGEGQDYAEQLKEFCKDNNLEQYVSFLGFRNDIDTLLKRMDVGVICSKSEAFGRVTVEYMLASMPVIGASGAGTSEIVSSEDVGFLYHSGSVVDLARYMHLLNSNRTMLCRMGSSAYRYARKRYTSQSNTRNIYGILNEIASQHKNSI